MPATDSSASVLDRSGVQGSVGYARGSRVSTSQPIHRTLHAQRPTVHDMKIGHRRPDISMTE